MTKPGGPCCSSCGAQNFLMGVCCHCGQRQAPGLAAESPTTWELTEGGDRDVAQRLSARASEDLLEILRRHDLDEWEPRVFEMARSILVERGIDVASALTQRAPLDEEFNEPDELVIVATFGTVVDAEPCRSGLLGAGFAATFLDHNTIGVDPALWPALGGVKIAVPQSQVDEARAFFAEAERGELAGGSEVAIQCPHCGSFDVRFAKTIERSRTAAVTNAMLAGFVATTGQRSYVCNNCGEAVE